MSYDPNQAQVPTDDAPGENPRRLRRTARERELDELGLELSVRRL